MPWSLVLRDLVSQCIVAEKSTTGMGSRAETRIVNYVGRKEDVIYTMVVESRVLVVL